jgi:TolA-binding protein
VYVHRGKVEIQSPLHPVAYVETDQTARLTPESVTVVASSDSLREINPLYELGCFDGGQTFSELTENECNRKVRKPSARNRSATGASHGANGSAKWRKSPSAAAATGLAQLLESVTQARRENDWIEVAALYRRILREYPGTPDSRTALVSLAQVEINRLNTPKAALRHFNAYLRAPGTLEPEALYGKAKVYRQLNNSANERRTLNTLISKYPTGPLSLAAEKRLRELSNL